MKTRRCLVAGVLVGWCLLSGLGEKFGNAQEGESAEHHGHPAATEERVLADVPPQPDAGTTEGRSGELEGHVRRVDHAPSVQVQMEGHRHHHRLSVLPPEEDKAYSELNHHIAGMFVLLTGGLAMLATVGGVRYSWARYGWPGLFFLLGVFLFVRLDPESWPWGPLSFWESVTEVQVVQHMLFICIVLSIGGIEWLRYRGTLSRPAWGWFFPSLAISAAIMLFMHKHGEGPAAEKIYRHHAIMATSGIVAMIAKVFDDSRLFDSKLGGYVWTGLIMFVGFMLLIYSE